MFFRPYLFLNNSCPLRTAVTVANTIIDPHLAKYRSKLAARATSLGFASVDELISAHRTATILPPPNTNNVPPPMTHKLPPHVKPLNQILHMDKLADKTPEFIEKLWIAHHLNKPNTSAVIPKDVYLTLHANALKYPTFVLPVFTDSKDTADTYVLQHSGHQTFFTSVLAYQTHGPNAPVMFTLTYYTDLIDSKNLVLMLGHGNCSPHTQKNLTEGMRDFYTSSSVALVHQMHTDPNTFNFNHVLELVKARSDS